MQSLESVAAVSLTVGVDTNVQQRPNYIVVDEITL